MGFQLFFCFDLDRGLCAGIHSSITKNVRPALVNDKASRVIVYGDRVRAQLRRNYGDRILAHFAEVGKVQPVFLNACAVAKACMNEEFEWEKAQITYNKFVSAIAYESSNLVVFNPNKIASAGMTVYILRFYCLACA